jgi:uncharacterized protein
MRTSLEAIDDFLARQRIAIVGVSRDPRHFSAYVFQRLHQQGYDVVPVNPHVNQIYGRKCFARLQDIYPAVDAALLMTPPEATETVVRDCVEAGVEIVWMHRATGKGSVSDKAVRFCQQLGIEVIPGQCPLMFLPKTGTVHRLHGWIRRMTGRYPRHITKRAA